MRQTARKAFTLGEMLVAVSLLALIATMLVPLVSDKTGERKLVTITKDAMAQIAVAYATYLKIDVPDSETTTADIVENINYVRIINDNSHNIQIDGTNYACNATYPCLLLHNGALIRYHPTGKFGNSPTELQWIRCWLCDPAAPAGEPIPHPNINALRFWVDPDGSNPEDGVEVLLFYSGRVTTRYLAPEAVVSSDSQPIDPDRIDPVYLWDWVRG
jgi:competence protein ComGC